MRPSHPTAAACITWITWHDDEGLKLSHKGGVILQVYSTTAAGQGTTTNVFNSALGRDDFLKLLLAQLRYQNPMNPMSSTESIAQLAQFSALEQMYNLNARFDLIRYELRDIFMLQAVSMIGKEVKAYVQGELITGIVSKVNWTEAGTVLTVNGYQIPIGAVAEVALQAAPEPEQPDAPGTDEPGDELPEGGED